jgi:hypothetical protein
VAVDTAKCRLDFETMHHRRPNPTTSYKPTHRSSTGGTTVGHTPLLAL